MVLPRPPRILFALVGGLLALGGCSHPAPSGSDERQSVESGSGATLPSSAEPPPCPPEDLSCGLQKPVLSDGVRRFENAEMGLSAVFPAGSRVCLTRSGETPRGFYAWYGSNAKNCPERGDISATYMSLSSHFNSLFRKSLSQAVPDDCPPLSEAVKQHLAGRPLVIPGHQSQVCQWVRADGWAEIYVYAMAGTHPDDEPDAAPHVVYWAALETNAERMERDLRMFLLFLKSVRVGTPFQGG